MNREVFPAEHVARLIGRSKLDSNGKPTGAAFSLRENEPYVSADCLEIIDLSHMNALRELWVSVYPARKLTPKGVVGFYQYQKSKQQLPSEYIAIIDDGSHVSITIKEIAWSEILANLCAIYKHSA